MNVPIKWISEYVKIPDDLKVFTDKMSMIGHLLDKTITTDNDTVVDLELRGNRSDTFSIIGIAREVKAAFNTPINIPEIKYSLPTQNYPKFKVEIKSEHVYRFYSCFIEGVKIGPSPEYIQKRLKDYGLDPINNIVDITNYVMIETGMPMHAFDMDKMNGNKLILRQAENKEKVITFDGSELTLDQEDIVFGAEDGTVLGLAGVVGSKNSGIHDDTVNVLLECAAYDRVSIRKTMRKYNAQTEAGLRHSHDLPASECDYALQRAAFLIAETCGGENVLIGIDDYYPNKQEQRVINFNTLETKRLGGVEISLQEQKEILESLEFIVEPCGGMALQVRVPLFRTDIFEDADLVEEVLRIWGYDKIPSKILSSVIPEPIVQQELVIEEKSRDILTALGLNEVITVPMTTPEKLDKAQEPKKDLAITLINPSSSEHTTMRTSLYIGLLEATKKLLERGDEKVSFFEVGKIYHRKDELIHQPPHKPDFPYMELRRVTGMLSSKKKNEYDFATIKGIVEEYLNSLLLQDISYVKISHPQFDYAASIRQGEIILGDVGKLKQSITENAFDIKTEVYAFTLAIDGIVNATKTPVSYMPYSQYPAVKQDMSVLIEKNIIAGDILNLIQNYNNLVRQVEIADVFDKDNKRSVLFKVTYQSQERTLSTEEINTLHKQIGDEIVKKYNAQISGRETSVGVGSSHPEMPNKNIIAARILSIEKHPDADRLVVCIVDVGAFGETPTVQIVTGANNIKVGDIVPVALPGVAVPGLKDDAGNNIVMKVAKLRGIESYGMMLAGDELGINSDHAGIYLLDEEKYTVGDEVIL